MSLMRQSLSNVFSVALLIHALTWIVGLNLTSTCHYPVRTSHELSGHEIRPVFFAALVLGTWASLIGSSTVMLGCGLLMLRLRCIARRRQESVCTVCGYDLRATPQRCPECGTVPNPPPSPSP